MIHNAHIILSSLNYIVTQGGEKNPNNSVGFNTQCAGMNLIPHRPWYVMIHHSDCQYFAFFSSSFNLSFVFYFVYEFMLLPMQTGMENLMIEIIPIIISFLLTQAVQRSVSNTGMFLNLNSQPFVPPFPVSLLHFHNVCLLSIT